ncbi:MAG: PfkB family carbohydrate kinase [Verrucomicrobiota bacterium]
MIECERKILGLEALAGMLRKYERQGRSVVHCHGCFDLLHPGHLRYLKAAREMGDLLVVTLTPDRYVDKGPGRPVYNQQLRAECLAALEFVDFVAINDWATAEQTIRLIRPRYFVKGQEFEGKPDQTGKLEREITVLQEVGAELRFTHEIVFSSSKLLNNEFGLLSPELKEYLASVRSPNGSAELEALFERIKSLRVGVIGDAIIDEYHFVQPLGMSSKATMPTSRYLHSEKGAGGALCIANHLASFCSNVRLVTCLGADDSQESFILGALNRDIDFRHCVQPKRVTVTKRRYVGKALHEKLFEVQYLQDETMDRETEDRLGRLIDAVIKDSEMIILADFGHGIMTPRLMKEVTRKAKFLVLSVQTNSANQGFNYLTKYSKAHYVVANEREARLACQARSEALDAVAKRILSKMGCDRLSITLGRGGSRIYSKNEGSVTAPIVSDAMVDTIGAGDAFLALSAPACYLKSSLHLSALLGNVAGAFAANVLGNSQAIRASEYLKFVEGLLK